MNQRSTQAEARPSAPSVGTGVRSGIDVPVVVDPKRVRDVPLEKIIRGTLPYVLIMVAVLALVAVFPQLATGLVGNVR